MPTGNENNIQIYIEIDGEMKPLRKKLEMPSIEECPDIVNETEILNFLEYCQRMNAISKKVYRLYKRWFKNNRPKYLTNNCRRRHHLPLIRRSKKK